MTRELLFAGFQSRRVGERKKERERKRDRQTEQKEEWI
jgi:hypothetical protein